MTSRSRLFCAYFGLSLLAQATFALFRTVLSEDKAAVGNLRRCSYIKYVRVCVCVCARARVCACAHVCACVWCTSYVLRQTLLYLDVPLQYVGQESGKLHEKIH